jgi:putative transposase
MADYRRVRVEGGTYFFTLVTNRRRPLFLRAEARRALHRAMVGVRRSRPFTLDAAVILPDHLHLLITLPAGDADYATRIMLIKKRFSETAKAAAGLEGAPVTRRAEARGEAGFWQRRYWEHTIRSESDYRRHLDYMMFNPFKHGLVRMVADWLYSSFHRLVRQGLYSPDWGGGGEGAAVAKVAAGE